MTFEEFANMKMVLFRDIEETIRSKSYSFLNNDDHATSQAGFAIEAIADSFAEMADEVEAGLAAQYRATLPK